MSAFFGAVCHTEALSPSMKRIVFDDDGLTGFTPSDAADQYVNALSVHEWRSVFGSVRHRRSP